MSKVADVRIKRAYDQPSADDGMRVLVDRIWPRGVSKEQAHIKLWLREVAPSTALRQWYGHDPEKWPEFRSRYETELRSGEPAKALEKLEDLARQGTLTLVFSARDSAHSQAAVLRDVLTHTHH